MTEELGKSHAHILTSMIGRTVHHTFSNKKTNKASNIMSCLTLGSGVGFGGGWGQSEKTPTRYPTAAVPLRCRGPAAGGRITKPLTTTLEVIGLRTHPKRHAALFVGPSYRTQFFPICAGPGRIVTLASAAPSSVNKNSKPPICQSQRHNEIATLKRLSKPLSLPLTLPAGRF